MKKMLAVLLGCTFLTTATSVFSQAIPVATERSAPSSVLVWEGTTGEVKDMALIEKTIIKAGETISGPDKWSFEKVGPGHLVGTITVRWKHYVAVDITFDTEKYAINYKDSKNMRYRGSSIHPSYNLWCKNLVNRINRAFIDQAESTASAPAPAPTGDSTKRLEELKKLLDQDLITSEEYEAKKAAILNAL